MADRRAPRGLPIPSISQVVVVGAALVAAWLIYSKFGRHDGDPEESVRGNPVASLYALEAYLRHADEPVPLLLSALDSPDPTVRKLGAYGLGRIGLAAEQAVDKLRERLADENSQVRVTAAQALVHVNPDKESAAAAIVPLLADSEESVRQGIRMELFGIGQDAVKPLRALLEDDHPATRFEVVRVLQYMQKHSNAAKLQLDVMDAVCKPLLEMLESEEPAVRIEALRLLQVVTYGSKWESLRTDLGDAFNDPDPNVRIEAFVAAAVWNMASVEQVKELLHDPARVYTGLRAVASLGEDAVSLLPDLIALLDGLSRLDGPTGSLASVLHALSALQTGARPAAERLVQIADTRRDPESCLLIASTLHAIGAEEDVVATVLVPLLLDPDPQRHYSWRAGKLLVKISPGGARGQVALLIPKLGSNETTVDKTVLFALYALGSQAQQAVPAVVPLLQNRDPWIVEFAGHMLGAAGIGSSDVAANLARVLVNGSMSYNQRFACADALADIGPQAQSVVPALLEFIGKSESDAPLPGTPEHLQPSVRALTIRALGRIGGNDANLVPVLRAQLTNRMPENRAAAADALGRVASRSDEVFTELIRRIRDDDAGVRTMAALAVGRLATGRTPAELDAAVAALMSALHDEYFYVWRAATTSLDRIGPAAGTAWPATRKTMFRQEQRSTGDVRSRRPVSLRQFSKIDELEGIDVPQLNIP